VSVVSPCSLWVTLKTMDKYDALQGRKLESESEGCWDLRAILPRSDTRGLNTYSTSILPRSGA